VSSHRGTPRRGSSTSDSEESDFGTRPSKRRRIAKASHKPKIIDVIPAERTSSRIGGKVVNYNEEEEGSVNEEDLMPNEHGEVWTYGILSLRTNANILVEETESHHQIDAVVDHRRIGGDGTASHLPI